jgi:PAS domain S-box-containing protein
VERQRARLQAVLGQISSGVITLDAENRVLTSNPAALTILGSALVQMRGQLMDHDAQDNSVVSQFSEQVSKPLQLAGDQEWSAEIEVYDQGGRRFLFCRGTILRDTAGQLTGRVIVIDDMTTIISAQRNAAWSEVARRLAHEIKNPLTPIQLSAERLRHKFHNKLEGSDIELLERLNQMGQLIPPENQPRGLGLKPVDVLVIAPSQPLDLIAARHRHELPKALRFFLRGPGATRASGAGVLSYLLFEPGYCSELIELGYQDAMAQKARLIEFLQLEHAPAPLVTPVSA